MKKGQITIGKWHFKLGIIPLWVSPHGYLMHFGIFKLLKYPPEGMMITKDCYTGFWLRKEINWQGFEITF